MKRSGVEVNQTPIVKVSVEEDDEESNVEDDETLEVIFSKRNREKEEEPKQRLKVFMMPRYVCKTQWMTTSSVSYGINVRMAINTHIETDDNLFNNDVGEEYVIMMGLFKNSRGRWVAIGPLIWCMYKYVSASIDNHRMLEDVLERVVNCGNPFISPSGWMETTGPNCTLLSYCRLSFSKEMVAGKYEAEAS